MISDTYPHNRMQAEKDRRWLFMLKMHVGGILLLCAAMLLAKPDYASAANFQHSPPEYPALPAAFSSNFDCTNGQCDNLFWSDDTAGNTCVWAGDDSLTQFDVWVVKYAGGYSFVSYDNSGNTSRATLKLGASAPYSACYNGTSWTYQANTNSISTTPKLERVNAAANFESTLPVYAKTMSLSAEMCCGAGYNTTVNNTISSVYGVSAGALVLNPNLVVRTINLTSTGALRNGVSREYTLEWEGMTYPDDQLTHIFWYPYGRQIGNCGNSEDGGCPYLERIVNGTTQPDGLTGLGEVSWNWTYPYAGSFTGTVIATVGCGEFSINTNYASCSRLYRRDVVFNISGETDPDEEYPNQLLDFPVHVGSQGTNRLVSDPQPFEWRLGTGMCPASSVSGVRIFRGYPSPQSTSDAGVILAGSSGSGTLMFGFESPVLKSSFYPYLHVYCANGSFHRIYNGSTNLKSRARGLYIVDEEWSQYWVSEWEVGGESSDYDPVAGSGAAFWVEKAIVERYEPVRMKFEFNVNFTVGDLAIYPDPSQISEFYVVDDPDLLLENTVLNYTISYENKGTYFPRIRVRSTSYDSGNPATYRDVWLGGEQTKNNSKYVTVTNAQYTRSEFFTDDGIFGLDPATFSVSFGETDNIAIKLVETVVSYVAKGALWVASFAYGAIKEAPVFNMVTDILNPAEGVCYQLPSQLFGMEIPENLDPDGEFCVDYVADNAMFPSMALAVKLVFGMSILFYVIRKFF